MTYETSFSKDMSLVTLAGDVDFTSADALSVLEKTLVDRENIVVDVEGLKYVDSSFLRFLIRVKEHADKEEPTTVELVGVKPKLRRALEVTGLSSMFEL